MKKIIVLLTWLVCALMTAYAQSGLEINSIFGGRYASDPAVTESIISGNQKFLKKNKLTVLATFKGPAATYGQLVERLVKADASKAIGKNVRYKDGALYFGLFILPPITKGGEKLNRYLYYLNKSGERKPTVLVVYLEGTLDEQQVSEFIGSFTRKSK